MPSRAAGPSRSTRTNGVAALFGSKDNLFNLDDIPKPSIEKTVKNNKGKKNKRNKKKEKKAVASPVPASAADEDGAPAAAAQAQQVPDAAGGEESDSGDLNEPELQLSGPVRELTKQEWFQEVKQLKLIGYWLGKEAVLVSHHLCQDDINDKTQKALLAIYWDTEKGRARVEPSRWSTKELNKALFDGQLFFTLHHYVTDGFTNKFPDM